VLRRTGACRARAAGPCLYVGSSEVARTSRPPSSSVQVFSAHTRGKGQPCPAEFGSVVCGIKTALATGAGLAL
jgi:hypothetical protein